MRKSPSPTYWAELKLTHLQKNTHTEGEEGATSPSHRFPPPASPAAAGTKSEGGGGEGEGKGRLAKRDGLCNKKDSPPPLPLFKTDLGEGGEKTHPSTAGAPAELRQQKLQLGVKFVLGESRGALARLRLSRALFRLLEEDDAALWLGGFSPPHPTIRTQGWRGKKLNWKKIKPSVDYGNFFRGRLDG